MLWKILKKILQVITGRVFVIGLFILIQILWLSLFFIKLASYSHWILISMVLFSVLIGLWIISRHGNPSYKILWLMFIAVFPFFGGLVYLCFGDHRPSRAMRKNLNKAKLKLDTTACKDALPPIPDIPESVEILAKYMESCSFPAYSNSRVKYYALGDDMFPDLIEDMQKAKHYIFMEYFIISEGIIWNSIRRVLKERAAHGVEIRLIYDDVGSVNTLPMGFKRDLQESGIKVLTFNPLKPALAAVMNNRNHRKFTVIDGHTVYTGGQNLSDEYANLKKRFGHWKDTGIRICGDGAFSYTQMTLILWNALRKTEDRIENYLPNCHKNYSYEEDGIIIPYWSSPFEEDTLAQDVYVSILSHAKKYCWIYSPYLAIDDEMQHALCIAAKRGVDVRIITPGIPDKKTVYTLTRSYYALLLKAGVKIYEYTPGFIHAKSYLVDDTIGVVGTINMDYRSLYLHMECGNVLVNCKMLGDMKKDYLHTFSVSHEVTYKECKTKRHSLLWRAILRAFSPLL